MHIPSVFKGKSDTRDKNRLDYKCPIYPRFSALLYSVKLTLRILLVVFYVISNEMCIHSHCLNISITKNLEQIGLKNKIILHDDEE